MSRNIQRISRTTRTYASLNTFSWTSRPKIYRTIDFIKSYNPCNYKTLEILIANILVLIFVICFWTTSSSSSRPPMKDSQRARTALQALQTVLAPNCSIWWSGGPLGEGWSSDWVAP
ncbi:hypothetical protein BDR03DRAFT_1010765 [Suillus americanus]|nr:hypothetical protein BDR03DRAFT_1010765 [Suillus americanus]